MAAPTGTPSLPLAGPMARGLAAGLLALGLSAAGIFAMYATAHRSADNAVRSELLQLARAAAAAVDGDLHRRIIDPLQAGSPDHLRALRPLLAFHRTARDVRYVYTAVLDAGTVRLVLSTNHLYRVPGDERPPDEIMEPYLEDAPQFRRALTDQVEAVDDEPVKDEDGVMLSAYAPFWDSAGAFVGVAGVDVRVDELDVRMAALRRGLYAALAGAVAASAAVGFLVGRLALAGARSAARDAASALALAEKRDEAERLNVRLKAALESAETHAAEARAAADAKGVFLATVSHEVRTPLNGIVGMTQLLQDTPLDARQQEYLRTVSACSGQLLAVINDVLDYSKLEAGRLSLEETAFSLGAWLEGALDLFVSEASAKGLELINRADPDLPARVAGDPLRLRQILVNLVGNALKFTETGQVEVFVVPGSPTAGGRPTLRLEVADSGIGVPEDKVALLFRPFSQGDSSTTRRYGGSGLGLAISRRLAEMMGGTIGYRPRPAGGSVFWVEVPLADPGGGSLYPGGRQGEGFVVCAVANPALAEAVRLWVRRSGRQAQAWSGIVPPGTVAAVVDAALGEAERAAVLVACASVPARLLLGWPGQDTPGWRLVSKPVRPSLLGGALVGPSEPTSAPPAVLRPSAARSELQGERQPLSLLVVEQEGPLREALFRQLLMLGYRSDKVCTGEEALAALRTRDYDGVFLGGGETGPAREDLEKRLRSRTNGGRRPWVALVSEGEGEFSGFDAVLRRPLRQEDLSRALETAYQMAG